MVVVGILSGIGDSCVSNQPAPVTCFYIPAAELSAWGGWEQRLWRGHICVCVCLGGVHAFSCQALLFKIVLVSCPCVVRLMVVLGLCDR